MALRCAVARDLLLISDLHLGSHLKPRTRGEFVHLAAKVEDEFPRFLAQYRNHGQWRLVINGDFIDFWNVEAGTAADERKLAVERLHMVLDEHPAVEEALVRFLEAGHTIVFVTGNHDAELLYEEVREALADRLEGQAHASPGLALGKAKGSKRTTTPASLTQSGDIDAGRVRFVPWFLREPGGVWIEHGHLFDAACSTGSQLSPTRRGRLVKSVAEIATRKFSNLMPEIDYDAPDTWTVGDYIRWATARGLRFMLRVAYLYLSMVGHMLGLWFGAGRADKEAQNEHERKLGRIAANAGLRMATLTALQDMAPPPASTNVWGILSVTQLDYVISFLIVFCSVPPIAHALGLAWLPALGLGLFLAVWGVLGVHKRRRPRDVAKDMLEVAASIGELTGVPLVLMGHSHEGTLERSGEVLYGNSGSWLDGYHLVIERDPQTGMLATAQLRHWRNAGVTIVEEASVPRAESEAGEGVTGAAPSQPEASADLSHVLDGSTLHPAI